MEEERKVLETLDSEEERSTLGGSCVTWGLTSCLEPSLLCNTVKGESYTCES